MPCSIPIPVAVPARHGPGDLLWPLAWLGLAAGALVLVLWWMAREPGFHDHEELQAQILSPLLSGNLALLTLTIAADFWLSRRELRRPWLRVGLWSGAAVAGAAASLTGVHAVGIWNSDTAVAAMFVVPATVLVVAPFLAWAVALLGTRGRCVLLTGYLLGTTAIIHFGVRVAARDPRGNYEAVLVACSLAMGLAIFIWLALWSARPVRSSA